VQKFNPVRHFHQNLPLSSVFRKVEIGGDYLVEFCNMRFAEVVLCDGNIGFQYFTIWTMFPGGETHIHIFGMVLIPLFTIILILTLRQELGNKLPSQNLLNCKKNCQQKNIQRKS